METRRDFIKKTAAIGILPLMPSVIPLRVIEDENQLNISIFSKHLQFLDYNETGAIAAELGFSGVDLTVRPKGHVLPESVKSDLPKAIEEIRAAGSDCKMITTSIESVNNTLDVDIIKTAGKSGIKYYRTHWFKYKPGMSMAEELIRYQVEIEALANLNRENAIIGYYQNHAGRNIGASFWEIYKLLEKADSAYFGTQYDIRHAIVEGGNSWQNGFALLKPMIKTIVLKDFKWGKENGKWNAINVPIGEGMVDFNTYFKLLKQNNLRPPISLHLEYQLGGAEKGHYEISIDKKIVFNAMIKDLRTINKLWTEA